MYIKIARTRDVCMPVRGHAHDAGLDFFTPAIDQELMDNFTALKQNEGVQISQEGIILKPGQGALIPSGIHIEIPIGYMGSFQNKSGVASKKRLIIGAQIIDTYFSGEIHIHVINVSDRDVNISGGEKLTQMILIPIAVAMPMEGALESFYESHRKDDYRGAEGFGSTGV